MTALAARSRFRLNREPPPLFNKRLFKAQAGIVITEKILRILRRPAKETRTAEELHDVKAVVSALKDIHRGLQYIKEALCKVVTYEKIESGVEICQNGEGSCLSCFYILSGSVEAKYKITNEKSGAANRTRDCDISYTHVAGEFLGLVSGDGSLYDYPPPDSIQTTEVSEFLIIDRELFHQTVKRVQNLYVREIEAFVNRESFLSKLPIEERKKLVPFMAKQEYPAGKVIVKQGDSSEHLFFVARGRCQYYRRVHISEVGREELVKLGQVEKGDFFGESVVIDGFKSFCSVASIGPVTCYLVNNWVAKTNEQILQLLREHRCSFFQDSDIMNYIRDSDVWQSYKREAVVDLVKSAHKRDLVVNWQNMTVPLTRAVEYGDARRRFSKPVRQDEMPGAPKPADALFVELPQWRRRTSAILTSNAAAVVKAVLLLRGKNDRSASAGDRSPATELRFPATSSFCHIERSVIKSNSAPAGSRSGRRLRSNNPIVELRPQSVAGKRGTHDYRSISHRSLSPLCDKSMDHRQSRLLRSTNRTPGSSAGSAATGNASKSRSSDSRSKSPQEDNRSQSSRGAKKRKKLPVERQQLPAVVKTSSSSTRKTSSTNKWTFSDPEAASERNFVSKPNFVVKEIINTGIPGRKASPKTYRRFPPSMFELLDEKTEEQTSLNPWGLSMMAGKWLRTVKKQRKAARDQEEPESPSPTPIIVIQDWSPDVEEKNERADSPQAQKAAMPTHRRGSRKMSRTPSPALNYVTEESEAEIKVYEEMAETESGDEKWYTEIHEARDLSYKQIAVMKQDIEEMERRGNQSKKTKESKEQFDQACGEPEDEIPKQQGEKDKTNAKRLQKCKSAKFSANEDARLERNTTRRRSRSRTFSGSISTSQESFDSQSRTRHDRRKFHRAQSLGRLSHSSASTDLDLANIQVTKRKQNVEEWPRAERTKKLPSSVDTTRKTSSKVEKRRHLLLSKVFGSVTRHHF